MALNTGEQNARIAACVNACRGIPDEILANPVFQSHLLSMKFALNRFSVQG